MRHTTTATQSDTDPVDNHTASLSNPTARSSTLTPRGENPQVTAHPARQSCRALAEPIYARSFPPNRETPGHSVIHKPADRATHRATHRAEIEENPAR